MGLERWTLCFVVSVLCLNTGTDADTSGWSFVPNTQYHIQTDEGPERHFRYQTLNGQYRKEKRLIDGTVIGTEGWLDPLGYLRLKDYVADSNGFRILRSKMVYVGKDRPIYNALVEGKRTPAQTGILVDPPRPDNPYRHWKPSSVTPVIENDINSNFYDSTSARTQLYLNDAYHNTHRGSSVFGFRNLRNYSQLSNNDYNLIQRSDNGDNTLYSNIKKNYQVATPSALNDVTRYPPYDGTHTTANGFQYYLKKQYHEEEQGPAGTKVGSFGYVDPFGIRRVIYYKTDPHSDGFLHQKNNKYVGFNGTPFDPAPTRPLRRNKQ